MAVFSTPSVLSLLRRSLALSVLWLLLTGAAGPASWLVGAPAVLIAAIVSTHLVPRTRVNVTRLVRFIPAFLLRSLAAAFDIARRTLMPGLPIAPALITYDTSLRGGLARVVFMNTVSLLPGTLSAALEGDRLCVHVLDGDLDHAAELARLEQTVARIFPGVGA
ncbi:MAG: Na+/H+ antiporter subunit E [Halioglobus sp.]|nr:Na+/H+ antiporter subunit E [Halioglobus sp.]